MCILSSFTKVDILCFGCMELKKISFDFHKTIKTPSCYFEKNLNTLLSFTLKKVFAPLHSAPAPLYNKFFKPLYPYRNSPVVSSFGRLSHPNTEGSMAA